VLILYLLNLLVIVNAVILTRRHYPEVALHDKILIAFTICVAQIVCFIMLLGVMGALTFINIIMVTVLTTMLVVIGAKKDKGSPIFLNKNYIQEFLIWVSQHKLLSISISLLLGFSLVRIFDNLMHPTYLWGSLIYHYVFPVEWLKNGNILNPPMVFGNPALRNIAMNGEFLFFWFIAPLKNAFIADLTSFWFYLAGIIACFGILRKLGVPKEISLFSGIVFSLTPQYFKHILFNGNDVIVASLFLIALNFALLLKVRCTLKTIVISGISLGLLWGTKSTAMLWGPLTMPLVGYYMLRHFKNIKIRNFIIYGTVFIMLFLVFGGFTYFRNYVETGNPFYPVEYTVFGLTLPGPVDYSNFYDNINLATLDLEEVLFHQSLGINFIIFAFPAFFLAFPIVMIKSKFRLSFDIIYFLLLAPIMIFVFYTISPFHTPSYVYHFIALGTLAAIYTLYRLNLPSNIFRWLIFLLVVGAAAELAGHEILIYSLVTSGLVFTALAFVVNRKIWGLYRISGVALACILLVSMMPLERYYEDTKYKNYNKTFPWEKDLIEAWNWLYELTATEPKNIAYAGSSPTLPLYGKGLKNSVYYASVNDKEPYLVNFKRYYHLHDSFQEWLDFMRQDGCLREKADFKTWLKNIRERDTDILFVMYTDDFKSLPIEDEWARAHHEIFRLVLANRRARIYEIVD